MRVTRLRLERLRDDERGAVVMFVAICLLVLIGMLVLTVDLGRGVAYKRQVVNGTDAAALAAAQQCALGKGSPAAQTAANAVLDQNVDLPVRIVSIDMPECNTPTGPELKKVTVTTSADIDYFFAPIFGISSGAVAARAVAVWGVSSHSRPVPISVDQSQLDRCGIQPNEPPTTEPITCDLEYPKDSLQEPRWGILDLSHWNDPNAAPCKVDANALKDMIANGGYSDAVELNGDPPGSEATYDCVDNGLSFDVWETMEGRTLIFPVIDILTSTGTVTPNRPPLGGTDCTGSQIESLEAQGYNCEIDTVNVVGWVVLHVTDVANNGSTVTVESVQEVTTGGGLPGATLDFGVRAIELVE